MSIEYYKDGKMKYHPEFHFNHKRAWMTSELKYLIERYGKDKIEDISLALGRTYKTIANMIYELKKQGRINK
ncbi:hypothetical protein [Shewanella sp. T24-MNA-CIBAN-0130]|uniref:hypothetical protein n=1 Tax=Shewanella sp. T24-MNA-CIBAN-0130 TaxID=3140470 RepID=UPI00332F1FE8